MNSAATWNRLIRQASKGDARLLIQVIATQGHWPEDEDTRARLLVVLMLGPWQQYREAFLSRVLDREDPFKAGVAELARLSLHGREGAAWMGTSGRPIVLNEAHREMARSFYAFLKKEHPDWSEPRVRDQVRAAFKIEDVSEATLRKILGVKKTAG
jgi:hypothetical protein